MIDLKNAVKNASEKLSELLPEVEAKQLEEVEMTEDQKYWLITLSYFKNAVHFPTFIEALNKAAGTGSKVKEYKIFKVDADTGSVLSMKIRSV